MGNVDYNYKVANESRKNLVVSNPNQIRYSKATRKDNLQIFRSIPLIRKSVGETLQQEKYKNVQEKE